MAIFSQKQMQVNSTKAFNIIKVSWPSGNMREFLLVRTFFSEDHAYAVSQ